MQNGQVSNNILLDHIIDGFVCSSWGANYFIYFTKHTVGDFPQGDQ